MAFPGFSKVYNLRCTSVPEDCSYLRANHADPDEMPHHMQHFIWVSTVCQSTYLQIYSIQKVQTSCVIHERHFKIYTLPGRILSWIRNWAQYSILNFHMAPFL